MKRGAQVLMSAGEVPRGAPRERAHMVEIRLPRVEARPHVVVGDRPGHVGFEKPCSAAVHVCGRESRVERDGGVKIFQRAVEIGLHIPQISSHAVVGRISGIEVDRGIAIC